MGAPPSADMCNFVWSVWRGFVSMAALKRSAAAIVVASLFALGLRLVEFWAMPLFCGSRPTGGDIGLLQRSAAGVSGFAIVFFPMHAGGARTFRSCRGGRRREPSGPRVRGHPRGRPRCLLFGTFTGGSCRGLRRMLFSSIFWPRIARRCRRSVKSIC